MVNLRIVGKKSRGKQYSKEYKNITAYKRDEGRLEAEKFIFHKRENKNGYWYFNCENHRRKSSHCSVRLRVKEDVWNNKEVDKSLIADIITVHDPSWGKISNMEGKQIK